MNNPQLTPYKFPKELEVLYNNFYHSKYHDLKRSAISKVRSYLTKGPIPHSIEMTALLTEAIIDDEEKTGIKLLNYEEKYPIISKLSEVSDFSMRMQYSICIIKFVNGLLDPFQQSLYNISLHKLANELKLPNYFVESRHVSTHERLPSLEMMRLIALRALKWLQTEYWENIINQYKQSNLLNITINDWIECIRNERKMRIKKENDELKRKNNKSNIDENDIKNLENILKTIKKLRKDELQKKKIITNILQDEIVKLQNLISTKPDEFIINILLFKNYLLLHGEKNENLNEKQLIGIRMIWGNVLKELDGKFILKLWKKLFDLSTKKFVVKYDPVYIEKKILNNQNIEYLQNECEYRQCIGWTTWILQNIDIVNNSNIGFLINQFQNSCEISKLCILILKEKFIDLIKECRLIDKFMKLENIMNKFWVIDNKYATKELEDIESDIEEYIQNKRVKPSIYLFETFPSWRPVPFGCPP